MGRNGGPISCHLCFARDGQACNSVCLVTGSSGLRGTSELGMGGSSLWLGSWRQGGFASGVSKALGDLVIDKLVLVVGSQLGLGWILGIGRRTDSNGSSNKMCGEFLDLFKITYSFVYIYVTKNKFLFFFLPTSVFNFNLFKVVWQIQFKLKTILVSCLIFSRCEKRPNCTLLMFKELLLKKKRVNC